MPRLYVRATAVVLNEHGEVLLVKHNRENMWALPGGQVRAAEDPAHRAIIEVAEETGVQVGQPKFIGRYAGRVAAHEVYLALHISGQPTPNHREVSDVMWWDRNRPVRIQQHVNAILALAGNALLEARNQGERGLSNR